MNETLSASDLAGRLDVDRSTISRWRSSGRLPSPITSPKSSGAKWSVEVVDKWLVEMSRVADLAESLRCEAADLRLPDATRRYLHAVAGMLSDLRIPLETRSQLADGYRREVGTMPSETLTDDQQEQMAIAAEMVQKSHAMMVQHDRRSRKGKL